MQTRTKVRIGLADLYSQPSIGVRQQADTQILYADAGTVASASCYRKTCFIIYFFPLAYLPFNAKLRLQVAASGRGSREAHRLPGCPATAACGGPRRSAELRLSAKLSAHRRGHETRRIGADLRHGEKDRGGGRGSFSRGRAFTLHFGTMQVVDVEFDLVRRLSTSPSPTTTPPSPTATPPVLAIAPTSSSLVPSCHTVWKYYCRDNFGWREYSEPVVRLIEEASSRGLKEVRFITLQNQYILNIREGFQQNAVFGFRRQIRKRPLFLSAVMLTPYLQTLSGLGSTQGPVPVSPTSPDPSRLYPETWLPMSSYQDFLQVPVAREDRSYRTVYSLFHKTVSETKFRILRILRVQNPFLWEKYKRKKEYMSRKMSEMDRMLNERHLFHGTSQDVVEGICKHNFDPRVCGKHATMFGQGSYFARKAVYSHNFSKRSAKGVHFMFLAKVLTGRVTVGNPSMRRPPPLNPRDPSSDLYDSCVDNWLDPQIFVIFNDDQSYPYFIIQYEEVPSTVSV
uniref:Poly [ADP-ribose] polymerase n=1 Tax=Paramormyrops kingsleyae TaxID=1676925 RepID=A0A3B3QV81_9TELE